MADSSYSGGIAERYATAVFDLAREGDQVAALESDVDALRAALDESADLRTLISSPVYTRDQQDAAIGALAGRMGLGQTMTNTLRLMAQKRRLFVLGRMLSALKDKIAEARGETTARVRTAAPLTPEQSERLAETLKTRFGRAVRIDETVDPSLIGGMVVQVGSKMIDTSVRARLNAMKNTMKEAG